VTASKNANRRTFITRSTGHAGTVATALAASAEAATIGGSVVDV